MRTAKPTTLKDVECPKSKLKHGDWVYTPDKVYGSGGLKHNVFQFDSRMEYSEYFGHEPRFYKLAINKPTFMQRIKQLLK